MRIVYVAGFFAPVLTELRSRLRPHLDNGSVVWIPQFRNGDFDINRFKSAFFDVVARGATEVLVCLFLFRGKEYLLDPVLQAIIDEAKSRSPELKVTVDLSKNARDAEGVISKVEAFKPSVRPPIPSGLDALEKWVSDQHDGRVVLHPRAAGGAKKSQYGDVNLIYSAIDLLGIEYWEMRTASAERSSESRERCEAKLRELGLEVSESISASRAGEEGDEYFVTYPLGTSRKRMLDHHIKKGSDREERFCLRIYFFWDEDSSKVVIGWLPGHLGTRTT